MNSFEKMLEEKKFTSFANNGDGSESQEEVIGTEDLCEWEWENGGERFVRYWGGSYGHRKGLFEYLVAHAIFMMDTPSWGVERTIEADRFLRAYRLNKKWVKQKVKEIENGCN